MKKVLILISGGIDSTSCIHYFKSLEFDVSLLFINYGQISFKNELKAVEKIATYYDIKKLKILEISGNQGFSKGLVLGRNGLLLMLGLMNIGFKSGIISLGIHQSSHYPDCNVGFIDRMQLIFDLYTDGTIQINAPFINLNKAQIYQYCIQEGIPTELTYSCELGKKQPCGECLSCMDLKKIELIK